MLFISLTLENLQSLGYESFEDLYTTIQDKYFGTEGETKDVKQAKELAACLSPEQKEQAKEFLSVFNYYDDADEMLSSNDLKTLSDFYSIFN